MTKRYGWLVSRQAIENGRLRLRGRRGDHPWGLDVIDFDRGLVGSSDPVCDMLVEDLSTYAGGVVVTKAAVELFKGGIRVVSNGGPDEVVTVAEVVRKQGGF